jgi:uroporphyrinogen decarboxylase
MQQVLSGLIRARDDERVPNIIFTKGGGAWLEDIALAGPDAVGLDWTIDIGSARARVGNRVALQGNLDPAALFGTPERICNEVQQVLERFGQGAGHVFNLGHGVSQHTDPERVRLVVNAVHEQSRAYH